MRIDKRFTLKTTTVFLTGLAAFGTVAPDAAACGGAWFGGVFEEPEVDHRIQGVPMAEKALEEGHTVAAAGYVIRMIPHIRSLDPRRSKLVERAQRVLALAAARHDGALPIAREVPEHAQGAWRGKEAEQRAENVEWSVDRLRAIAKVKENDPGSETDLAEALSHLDGGKKEARTILERLAKTDLITSPEGYAALAQLRAESGDAAGEQVAMQRCERMARSASVCRAGVTG
jgi:hypothetical protein